LNRATQTKSTAELTDSPGWLQRVLIGRKLSHTLVRAAVWAGVCVFIFKFLLLPIRVEGVSMLPTYKENQINFLNCMVYWFHPPRRGDVVGIRLAGKHVMFCKRIVGLPGESVSFHDGRLFINGKLLDEPYVRLPCHWEHEPILDGPDEYYVVGDNRSMDFYDHEQGRAERGRIVGRVLF
jgi:signal peptidase I